MLLAMAERNRNSLFAIATILVIFTFVGRGAYGQCDTPLLNTIVYEGALNTILGCASEPNTTAWSVRPTTEANKIFPITNYDDFVNSNFTNLYAINGSGLIVRNATINPTNGPISTAGVYFVNRTLAAAKLVVIRSGPICICIPLGSGAVNISCNVIYADHPVAPIVPVVNCTGNGQLYSTDKPVRTYDTINTIYMYNSTSTITINSTVPTTYECKVTFSAPTINPPPYLAKNAPNFTMSFTLCEIPTTTAPSTTTTRPTTVTTKPPTTTTELPTTTIKPPTTTTQPPTTSTKPPTTTSFARPTTIAQTTTTIQPLTTTNLPTTTTPSQTSTTASTPAPLMTTTQPTMATQQSTSPNEIDLLTTKIILGTILGILLLATAAVGCCWCCYYLCPPLLPFRGPTRYFPRDMRMFQRREWIPVKREIQQTEYWGMPFYQQSFCRYPALPEYRLPSKYPTPCEYRLPSRCRCVQSSATQASHLQECRCGHQARIKAYCSPYAKRLP